MINLEDKNESEKQRIKRIRESDITKSLHLFNAEFEEALEQQRQEGVSAVDRAAWERMQTHFPETAEEIKEFEKEFPDCNGIFIWAMRGKIFREKQGIWI